MNHGQSDTESTVSASAERTALATEQARVDRMYRRLDELRENTEDRLAEAHAQERTGYAALEERETRAFEQARRRAQLGSVEEGLCFGRIDLTHPGEEESEARYVGRIGLRDSEHETILVDWRAPAARPFYAATPFDTQGVTRRRSLRVRRRRVVGLDDDVLDADQLPESERAGLVGEAALLDSLQRGRTGRMGDIVATIQAEQDRVIRAPLSGIMVVQGGPGTGKTVAALHRAAYLLYTHRRVLERRGVLVLGPNPAFLRYIGDVLPALGESEAVMRTLGEIVPGVRATAHDDHERARLKGSVRMVDLVRAAVRDRQRSPEQAFGTEDLHVATDAGPVTVSGSTCAHVLETARGLGLAHNVARKYVVTALLHELARAESHLIDRPVDEEDLPFLAERLWFQDPVHTALEALWPYLTAQQLLDELWSDPAALARVGERAGLRAHERALLAREPAAPFTVEDVPLLDEAAELLGEDNSAEQAAERRRRAEQEEEVRYAQGALEITGMHEDNRIEVADFAAFHHDGGPERTTAERAASDREWAYGHAVVDEAQELSAMAWRAVVRRVPTRSLTVVGDLAQTGGAGGAGSWTEALEHHAPGKVHVEHLRVNYRTPAPIMAVAADVLAQAEPGQEPPESVRTEGDAPRAVALKGPWEEDLPGLVEEELAAIGEGRLALITADRLVEGVARAVPAAARPAPGRDALSQEVVSLTATEAKGLEFDSVIVVEPGAVLEQPRGANDLYVGITRATRRLTVAHSGGLPPVLDRLREAARV